MRTSSSFTCSLDLMLVNQILPRLLSFGTASYRISLIWWLYIHLKSLLRASVESQSMFTAQPIKRPHLKYSACERDFGSDVTYPILSAYGACVGFKLHICCWAFWYI